MSYLCRLLHCNSRTKLKFHSTALSTERAEAGQPKRLRAPQTASALRSTAVLLAALFLSTAEASAEPQPLKKQWLEGWGAVEAMLPSADASVKRFFYYLRRRCAWSEEVAQKQEELAALFLSEGIRRHNRLRVSGPKQDNSATLTSAQREHFKLVGASLTATFFRQPSRADRRAQYKRHW